MPDLRHRCQYDTGTGRCERNRAGASRWCSAHGLTGVESAVLRTVADLRNAVGVSASDVWVRLSNQGYRRPTREVIAAFRELVRRGLLEQDRHGYYWRTDLQPIVRDLPAIFWRKDGRIWRVGTADWLESQSRSRAPLAVWHTTQPSLDASGG